VQDIVKNKVSHRNN